MSTDMHQSILDLFRAMYLNVKIYKLLQRFLSQTNVACSHNTERVTLVDILQAERFSVVKV